MRVDLAYISTRRQRLKTPGAHELVSEFVERAQKYLPVRAVAYESEAELLTALDRSGTRTPTFFAVLDSRGELLTSEDFARKIGQMQDSGLQHAVVAVGPADGWGDEAYRRARMRVAFGRITLPHELALVLLAEQVYRALTILAGHPYHSGHA